MNAEIKTSTVTLSRFENPLKLLTDAGFKPIAVSVMTCEDVFVFETDEEAVKAYEQFENTPKGEHSIISGWWYGRIEFMESLDEYEKEMDYRPDVIWLNEVK